MRASPPETLQHADDGVIVVEAPTAEAALEEVTTRLGPGARIVSASKVTRGGIGGFFARELVQLRAAVGAAPAGTTAATPAARPTGEGAPTASASPAQATPAPAPAEAGLTRVLSELAADTDGEERSFAEVLRARITEFDAGLGTGHAPAAFQVTPAETTPSATASTPAALSATATAAASPAPAVFAPATPAVLAPAAPAPAPLPQADAAPGGPDWSLRNLQKLGLPGLVVDACRHLDPRDDGAWVTTIAHAVATLCRPLPAGPAVVAGPRAPRLAPWLGAPVVKPGAPTPRTVTFCTPAKGAVRHIDWLRARIGRRWLHLVVGGDGWRNLLFEEPLAVSWVGDEALCDAVRLAAELGLVLGYGLAGAAGADATRANPVDVAYAIRAQVPRR